MSQTLLSVKRLSKAYTEGARKIQALSNINLTLAAGETLGVTGPSGCGKSTLARSILRLIEPDSGEILVDGVDWNRLSSTALRRQRRDMQMVFQNSSESFNRFTSVRAAITEPLRIHDIVPKHQRESEIERLLSLVALDEAVIGKSMSQLSGGQRQRVAIARAIASRPKILILDEAVSALDMIARRAILELIVALQQRTQLSVLFISHDFAAIQAICHRVLVMDRGAIIEEGQTAELISDPKTQLTQSLLSAVPHLE